MRGRFLVSCLLVACGASPAASPSSAAPVENTSSQAVAPAPSGASLSACGVCKGTPGEALAATIRQAAQDARHCYTDALAHDASLEGRVVPHLRVAATGAVCGVTLDQLDPALAPLGPCVQHAFEKASYPPPDGGCTEVSLTLVFTTKK